MKCFYHRDLDAVGVCKACGKGLCGACAEDVGGALACRETCQEEARILRQTLARSARLQAASEQALGARPQAHLSTGALRVLVGVGFIILAEGPGRAFGDVFRIGTATVGVLVALLGTWHIVHGWRQRHPAGEPQ